MGDGRKWFGANWIRADKRLAIHIRDKFTCLWCERDLRDAEPGDLTLDHVTPVSRGGTNEHTNLITACRSCNSKRQDRDMWAWMFAVYGTGHDKAYERVRAVLRATRRKLNRDLAKALIAERHAQPQLFSRIS